MKAIIHVDGGARGNPGPAGIGVVISTETGDVIDQANAAIGQATNNVAEYRALLLGLQRAQALGLEDVEVVNDSELVAKQINGEYKVKHEAMKPLHREAIGELRKFKHWQVRTVPRAQNQDADRLVNLALDGTAVDGLPDD